MSKRTCLLTCPICGNASVETMPTDACVYFHECAACGAMLRAKAGDCCVFCSYGSTFCPPKRARHDICSEVATQQS